MKKIVFLSLLFLAFNCFGYSSDNAQLLLVVSNPPTYSVECELSVASFDVTTNGEVENLTVHQYPDTESLKSIEAAIIDWKFRPASRDYKVVSSKGVILEYSYSCSGRKPKIVFRHEHS